MIISESDVIVTTCLGARNKKLRDFKFEKVIIDEATQASELEIFNTLSHANQLVLIGDPKQLASMQSYEIDGCDSLIQRMSEIDKNLPKEDKFSVKLNVQYRMHPKIWALSN